MDSTDAQTKASDAGGSSASSRGGVKRYLWIGLPILLALGVALFLYWPRLELGFTINALNSDSAATFRDSRSRLVRAPREPWVDDLIREAIEDSSRTFKLRKTLVGVLQERRRVPLIETIYLEGDLDARGPILGRLQSEPFFESTFVDDERWQVKDTVRRWMQREGDRTRWHALQLVQRLELRELVPQLREMLTADRDVRVDARKARFQRIGSMRVLARFGDCESVPAIVEAARNATEPGVRSAALDALETLVMRKGAPCADAVDDTALHELTARMLESEQREVAIKALTHLELNPERAKAHLAHLQEAVKPGAGDRDGILRRHALLTLMAIGQPAFLDTLPVYFHDENAFMRSTVAEKSAPLTEGPRLESCLIGLIDRETAYLQAWRSAVLSMRRKSGDYPGLPAVLVKQARDDRGTFLQATLPRLFEGQVVEGADRAALVDAWFQWFAKDLGLDEAGAARAAEVRKKFWALVDADKLDQATAELESFGEAPAGLFAYEETYLVTR